jgi:hypothetical protein
VLFAAFVMGHPTTISCDDVPAPGYVVPAGYVVEGWAYLDGSEIHLAPSICAGLSDPQGPAFGRSFNVLAHEVWHATGVGNEACAEQFARIAPFEYMVRFWRMGWDASLRIAKDVADYTSRKPLAYQVYDASCLEAISQLEGR